MSVVDTDN